MPKRYHISKEDTKEIRIEMSKTKKKSTYRRLEAVALRGEGKSNKEVAEITKYHEKRVSQLVSLYCNEGIEALADGRKGGNHRLLSLEEEKLLLNQFEEKARMGQILTVAEMKKEYDKMSGRESSVPAIYLMLKRHGWRKIMPRSKHPNKASDEVIEASKKLTLESAN